jgi:large repetitive protein
MMMTHLHPRRGLLSKLSLTAVLALLGANAAATGTPGLPFTEDFSTTTLRDEALTNANWSPEEQAVYLAWSQRRQRPSFVAGSALGGADDLSIHALLADMNGDGHLDLVVANVNLDLGPQFNRLYLNDGNGGFPSEGIVIGSDDMDRSYSVAVGDVDGDGHLDIVIGNYWAPNKLYLNDGNGGFPESGIAIGSESDNTRHMVLGDVDGDGDLDLLVGNSGQNRLYLNDGLGNFSATGINVGSEIELTMNLALGDIDGDGDLDLIVANRGHLATTKLYLNDGLGGFSTTGIPLDTTLDTFSIALGDVNGDGHLDLIANGLRTPRLRLYLNDGSGGFLPATQISDSFLLSERIILADIDGDGDLDLIMPRSGSSGGEFNLEVQRGWG